LTEMATSSLLWDAPCSVTEPTPRQLRYPIAILMTSTSERLWMVQLQRTAWLHVFPHLVVSDWSDTNATLVGMHWGSTTTHKALAGCMCLANAMSGRFSWMLVADDDTVPDLVALRRLVGTGLDFASPREPWLMAFVAQPWVRKTKFPNGPIGCVGNVTTPCHFPPCRKAVDITRPCIGEPIAGNIEERGGHNLNLLWPYGGAGFLLSAAAAAALHGHPSRQRSEPERAGLGHSAEATATIGARSEGARLCLRQFTCPWGSSMSCDELPSFAGYLGNSSRSPGLCRRPWLKHGVDDCRMCGNTDVQLACCLGTRGVFTTDLTALDGRQTPGDAHWSPWAAHFKGYRSDRAIFEQRLQHVMQCGLSRGPMAWRRPCE